MEAILYVDQKGYMNEGGKKMVRSILGMFMTEQKVESVLSHPIIEVIFFILIALFIVATLIHFFLFLYVRPIRSHLKQTGKMDLKPLDQMKQEFERKNLDANQVETFVQEQFSNWRYLQIPIVHLVKMIQATVSIFILLGVLGTFIGLTISLGNLHITSEQFVENAANVLSGIDIAFYTSIVGMSFSLIMTLFIHGLNIEYLFTDLMLMVEAHLTEEHEYGVNALVKISDDIHDSIRHMKKSNETALQRVVQSFTGFQDYTSGLKQSAKDLKAFNDGLAKNLIDFQQIFTSMEEISEVMGEGTTTLNENFSTLFASINQAEERREEEVKRIQEVNKQMKETAVVHGKTRDVLDQLLEDFQQFSTKSLEDQSGIHQTFDQTVQKSEQLVRTMENHHQEFKNVFGQNIGGRLEEIQTYLQDLARDFNQLGTTLPQFPKAFAEINQTQNEYRQLLTNQFRDMENFQQAFGTYLQELTAESTEMERNIRDAATSFAQMSQKNNQLFQEIHQSLTEMDQMFSEHEQQLERSVDFLRDALTDAMRNMTGTMENRLDQMVRQINETMKRTGEDIHREFTNIQRLHEDALQSNHRLMQQLIQEIGRQFQSIYRDINQRQLPEQSGWKSNDF